MKVKVQKDGRIKLPKELRSKAHIRTGQWLDVSLQDTQVVLQASNDGTGLILSEDHLIWALVGQWGSGQTNVSRDKYAHLAQAYASQR